MIKFYFVKFSKDAKRMRMRILNVIESVDILDCDEHIIIACDEQDCEAVEYELRKAERRDGFCFWEEIKSF